MKVISWLSITFLSLMAFGQVTCTSFNPDSSIIWQENRFFIHEYVLSNSSQENFALKIIDSFDYQSQVSVQYSFNEEFVTDEIELTPGNNIFRVWVRYNQNIPSLKIPFEIKNHSFSFIDTIKTFNLKPKKPFVHSQQTFQYLDYYSPDIEKTEMQLFDQLWNLVGTYDAKMERIDLQAFTPATYFLKIKETVLMIKLIDPEDIKLFIPQTYSTIYHKTSLTMDKSK